MAKKRSFFERLTGGIRMEDESHDSPSHDYNEEEQSPRSISTPVSKFSKITPHDDTHSPWQEEDVGGQLAVDVYQTPGEIIVQTMVAGVRPEDLSINITRDMITIRGKREENRTISEENYFTKELYWGSFSRTILLPQEIDPESTEAIEKHGLLIIKLPKLDKGRQTSIKVKSL